MMLDVVFGGFRRMMSGMLLVPMREMRMMRRFFVSPGVMLLGGLFMMMRGMLVMFGCFLVLLRCVFGHCLLLRISGLTHGHAQGSSDIFR
jgi:hypothetical protein